MCVPRIFEDGVEQAAGQVEDALVGTVWNDEEGGDEVVEEVDKQRFG